MRSNRTTWQELCREVWKDPAVKRASGHKYMTFMTLMRGIKSRDASDVTQTVLLRAGENDRARQTQMGAGTSVIGETTGELLFNVTRGGKSVDGSMHLGNYRKLNTHYPVVKIGIIGAGPVGLITAYHILRDGLSGGRVATAITIYEKYPLPEIKDGDSLMERIEDQENTQSRFALQRRQVFFLKQEEFALFDSRLQSLIQRYACAHAMTPDMFSSFECVMVQPGKNPNSAPITYNVPGEIPAGYSMEVRTLQLLMLMSIKKLRDTNGLKGGVRTSEALKDPEENIKQIMAENDIVLNCSGKGVSVSRKRTPVNIRDYTTPRISNFNFNASYAPSSFNSRNLETSMCYDSSCRRYGGTFVFEYKGNSKHAQPQNKLFNQPLVTMEHYETKRQRVRTDFPKQYLYRMFPSRSNNWGGRIYIGTTLTKAEYDSVSKSNVRSPKKTLNRAVPVQAKLISRMAKAVARWGVSPATIDWTAQDTTSAFTIDLQYAAKPAEVITSYNGNPLDSSRLLMHVGDAAFSAHFFTFSGLNNGLKSSRTCLNRLNALLQLTHRTMFNQEPTWKISLRNLLAIADVYSQDMKVARDAYFQSTINVVNDPQYYVDPSAQVNVLGPLGYNAPPQAQLAHYNMIHKNKQVIVHGLDKVREALRSIAKVLNNTDMRNIVGLAQRLVNNSNKLKHADGLKYAVTEAAKGMHAIMLLIKDQKMEEYKAVLLMNIFINYFNEIADNIVQNNTTSRITMMLPENMAFIVVNRMHTLPYPSPYHLVSQVLRNGGDVWGSLGIAIFRGAMVSYPNANAILQKSINTNYKGTASFGKHKMARIT